MQSETLHYLQDHLRALRPINSDNARPFCITAAAGTELARATLVVYVIILWLTALIK